MSVTYVKQLIEQIIENFTAYDYSVTLISNTLIIAVLINSS